ncbi:MAG: hypothetical protein ACKV19_20210 [Verrucomicrobiales bacterium]
MIPIAHAPVALEDNGAVVVPGSGVHPRVTGGDVGRQRRRPARAKPNDEEAFDLVILKPLEVAGFRCVDAGSPVSSVQAVGLR